MNEITIRYQIDENNILYESTISNSSILYVGIPLKTTVTGEQDLIGYNVTISENININFHWHDNSNHIDTCQTVRYKKGKVNSWICSLDNKIYTNRSRINLWAFTEELIDTIIFTPDYSTIDYWTPNWIGTRFTVPETTETKDNIVITYSIDDTRLTQNESITREVVRWWYTPNKNEWLTTDYVQPEATIRPIEDVDLYADWEIITTTTLLTNPALLYGYNFKPPTGYQYWGWTKDLNVIDHITYSFEQEILIDESILLYAKTTPIKYTVIYEQSYSGTIKDVEYTYTYGQEYLPPNSPGDTYQGSTFRGWRRRNQLPYEYYALNEPIKNLTTTNNQTIRLIPAWLSSEYTIYYNSNDADQTEILLTTTHKPDTIATIPNNTQYTKQGYKFIAWNTKKDGSGFMIYPGDQAHNWMGNDHSPTHKFYLWAQWAPSSENIYTINYYDSENTEVYSNSILTEDSSCSFIIGSPKISQDSFEFMGWSTIGHSDTVNYQPKEEITLTESKNTINLYGVWKQNQFNYEIWYKDVPDTDEWRLDSESITNSESMPYTILLDTPPVNTLPYYKFLHWKEKNTEQIYLSDTTLTLTEDTILYLQAVWEPITYTYNITYHEGEISATDTYSIKAQPVVTDIILRSDALHTTNLKSFQGWSLSSSGETVDYAPEAVLSSLDTDIDLYAVYTTQNYNYIIQYFNHPNDFTNITWQDDESKISSVALEQYNITIDEPRSIGENYTFLHWSTNPYNTDIYLPGSPYTFSNGPQIISLYAIWEKNQTNQIEYISTLQNGQYKKGIPYAIHNEVWKKYNQIYRNLNGTWIIVSL